MADKKAACSTATQNAKITQISALERVRTIPVLDAVRPAEAVRGQQQKEVDDIHEEVAKAPWRHVHSTNASR